MKRLYDFKSVQSDAIFTKISSVKYKDDFLIFLVGFSAQSWLESVTLCKNSNHKFLFDINTCCVSQEMFENSARPHQNQTAPWRLRKY